MNSKAIHSTHTAPVTGVDYDVHTPEGFEGIKRTPEDDLYAEVTPEQFEQAIKDSKAFVAEVRSRFK